MEPREPLFVHVYFDNYVPENTVRERLLDENPRPDNLVSAKKTDDFLSDILKEKKKKKQVGC